MNIKRFHSHDMRTALQQIRTALGSEAVILSSQKVAEGVEVIAAIDYDGSAVQETVQNTGSADIGYEALRPQALNGASQNSARQEVSDYEHLARQIRSADDASAGVGDSDAAGLSDEIKGLKRLLESQLASLAWNDLNRRRPARARALRQFSKLGIDPDLARDLVARLPKTQNIREVWRLPLKLLSDRIPLAKKDLVDIGGVFAIVGPTGVGKTTSIAKIAARFVLRNNVQDLGLISTDFYRIGARDQLLTFARILGAPMHVAENASELQQKLTNLRDKKLVLIDTAGMSQRDVRLAKEFATLRSVVPRVNTVLTLSAAADSGCLAETFDVFKQANPKALIITKLDEAASYGAVLSLAIRNSIPVAYLANGQRVPEDLHLAGPKRLWLVQNAAQLARNYAGLDEEVLAEEFGPMEFAANG